MTTYSVYDETTKEHETFYSVSPAKKWMKERIKLGHDVHGDKTKIYSNGDWVPCGEIDLNGSNKTLVVGATRQTVASY